LDAYSRMLNAGYLESFRYLYIQSEMPYNANPEVVNPPVNYIYAISYASFSAYSASHNRSISLTELS